MEGLSQENGLPKLKLQTVSFNTFKPTVEKTATNMNFVPHMDSIRGT